MAPEETKRVKELLNCKKNSENAAQNWWRKTYGRNGKVTHKRENVVRSAKRVVGEKGGGVLKWSAEWAQRRASGLGFGMEPLRPKEQLEPWGELIWKPGALKTYGAVDFNKLPEVTCIKGKRTIQSRGGGKAKKKKAKGEK